MKQRTTGGAATLADTASFTTSYVPTQTSQTGGKLTSEQAMAKKHEQLNKNVVSALPPGVEGNSYGHLFVEIGSLSWLTYDGEDYLQDQGPQGKGVNNLFANIKFWGDNSKGLYLKFANGMKKKETVTNKFKYDVKTPERTFENYLDDMGVLIVDFYDTAKSLTVGTAKIMLKLYIKRAKSVDDDTPMLELRGTFPIVSTGNANIKIGEFALSMITSFTDPYATKGLSKKPQVDLNDSFTENEKQAAATVKPNTYEKNKSLISGAFSDDRVPSSLQQRQTAHSAYRTVDFDEQPVKQTANAKQISFAAKRSDSANLTGKENKQRNIISIDENDDTFHNKSQFDKIFARGEKLRNQMTVALETEDAWETLHGQHHVPKTYVPPFLQQKEENKSSALYDDPDLDNIYALEFEGDLVGETPIKQTNHQTRQGNNETYQENTTNSKESVGGSIMDMKFIKIKIKTLKVESEEILHDLIDNTFNLIVDVPLPDIYQKKIAHQILKLNNYDVVSFNEYAFNNSTTYNFKIDDQTFNQLVQAHILITIEGQNINGILNMNRILLANNYKLEATVRLQKTINTSDEKSKTKQQNAQLTTKGKSQTLAKKGGESTLNNKKSKAQTDAIQGQTYTKDVGSISIEINLQRGDSEQELERDYQIKLKTIEERKQKEVEEQKVETSKQLQQFSMRQETKFAQLYMHIDSIRTVYKQGMSTGHFDATARQNMDDSFNNRQNAGASDNSRPASNSPSRQREGQQEQQQQPLKRNLLVKYKAFPNLERLQTNTIFGEAEPKFSYRSQFPIDMNPNTVEKLQKFTFVLEVWDQATASKEELVGLVKIPLASFCYSMRTTDERVFSLNFLADQHCLYPMIIADDYLPIQSFKSGQNVGELKVTLAMGSPVQINRQIQKEQTQERQTLEFSFKQQMQQQLQLKEEQEKQRQLDEQKAKEREQDQKQRMLELEQDRQRQSTPPRVDINNQVQEQMMNFFTNLTSPTKTENNFGNPNMMGSVGNFMRQSIQQSVGKDLDIRKTTYLNSIRKLFEEARINNILELDSEDLFKDNMRNFDGSVKKDDFIYVILNRNEFSLTRAEVSNICSLILNINRDDKNNIDLDAIQNSYKQYLRYHDNIEPRIIDLFEKIDIVLTKKLDQEGQRDHFLSQIQDLSVESKVPIQELKDIFENQGLFLSNSLYDQLSTYFDLDRNGCIHITSFLEYLRNPTAKNINFFKVSPHVIASYISEFVRTSLARDSSIDTEKIEVLEQEFKSEIHKNQGKSGEIVEIPAEILIGERINAKLFQYKMKRFDINLSLWEVFTLFDQLNTQQAKMFYEPQRYHFITFDIFYRFITNKEYAPAPSGGSQMGGGNQSHNLFSQVDVKASAESAFALASALNQDKKAEEEGSGIYSSKSESQMDENSNNGDDDEVVQLGGKKQEMIMVPNKKVGKKDEVTFSKHADISSVKDEQQTKTQEDIEQEKEEERPYKQIKHIFEVKVKELVKIPILDKLIKDVQGYEQATKTKTTGKRQTTPPKKGTKNQYIQNVSVKYTFPLDDDEVFESDYLQQTTDDVKNTGSQDISYVVSMDTVHTYTLSKDDKIQKTLGDQANNHSQNDSIFNISIVLYEDGSEFVVGNTQLPIEDIIDLVESYDNKNGNFSAESKKAVFSRTQFIYGTAFSQRENCIIGKMNLEIFYSTQRVYLTGAEATAAIDELYNDDQQVSKSNNGAAGQSCFMHKETYINRKIPLNAVIFVSIDKVSNMKEAIQNIEHFSKIQQAVLKEENQSPPSQRFGLQSRAGAQSIAHSTMSKSAVVVREQADRKKVMTQILRHGLNLAVQCSLFEEDQQLKRKMTNSKYTSRLVYNTLNPSFNEQFEQNLQMDTQIFEYLKNKKAVFEIRHYLIQKEEKHQNMTQLHYQGLNSDDNRDDLDQRADTNRSYITEEDDDIMERNDFIVLGHVRVSLLALLTKNTGIDGDFVITDDYKQPMGNLKLRITLNHPDAKRPNYSGNTGGLTLMTKQNNNNQNQDNTFKKTFIGKSLQQQQLQSTSPLIRAKAGGLSSFDDQSQYLLGLNFVELILKNKYSLFHSAQISSLESNQQSFMYLKFRIFGKNYQTKFLSSTIGKEPSQFMKSLNLIAFDIKKTVWIDIDFDKPREIEEAFSSPLEVQLWFKKEATQRHQQPEKEYMMGSFYIELNELSQRGNKRIKEQNGLLQVHEGYFTIYDFERENVGLDRLGAKLYLIKKEDENQFEELEALFYNKSRIEKAITDKLDHLAKGYVDLDDLKGLLQKELEGSQLEMMTQMVECLEYKNSDKVYYSPLFGLPQPYFRYGRRFDAFGVIEKFDKELASLDDHERGFVSLKLFESQLEGMLKIKRKIVEDFIDNMRHQDTLDVNIKSHSLKTHLDYVVLLRKLALYFEIKLRDRGSSEQINSQRSNITNGEEIVLKIDIESAKRIRVPANITSANSSYLMEAPNTYVQLKVPFNGANQSLIKTQTVHKSTYPTWYCNDQQIRFAPSEHNLKLIMSQPLEFEVYHQELNRQDKVSVQHIGTAFVDLSQMVFVNNLNAISGFFHITQRDRFEQTSHLTTNSPTQLVQESLGQIKISISTNVNLKQVLNAVPAGQSLRSTFSPLKRKENEEQFNPFGHSSLQTMSFAKNQFVNDSRMHEMGSSMGGGVNIGSVVRNDGFGYSSNTHNKLQQSMKQFGLKLQNLGSEEDIVSRHNQAMSELDSLNEKMRQTLSSVTPRDQQNQDNQIHAMFRDQQKNSVNDFTMTRGGVTGSHELQHQLKQFAHGGTKSPIVVIDSKFSQATSGLGHMGQIVNEVDTLSEFSRDDDNIFQNNIGGEAGNNKKLQASHITEQEQEESTPNVTQKLHNMLSYEEAKPEEDEKEEDELNFASAPPKQYLEQSFNVFEKDQMKQSQNLQNHSISQQYLSTPGLADHESDNEDDDDLDEENMRRLERILKSQPKK